jgi:hypothetical protein
VNDKTALRVSNAGMRLIAQTTIFNRQEAERLREFIEQSYSDQLLEQQPLEERLNQQIEMFIAVGKLRVFQVLATDKHRVVVLMQSQADEALYYTEMAVEEDYPHKIIEYTHRPLD